MSLPFLSVTEHPHLQGAKMRGGKSGYRMIATRGVEGAIAMSIDQDQSSITAHAADDTQQHYDLLKAGLQAELDKLAAQKSNWFAVSNYRIQVEQMDRQYVGLVKAYDRLRESLQQAETVMDCSELLPLMQGLDQAQERFHEILHQSWQLIEFKEMLDAHNSWLDTRIGWLEADDPSLLAELSAQRFNYLLEDRQNLALQLEQFEKQGHDVEALIPDYEMMSNRVSQLQDVLDQL